MKAFLSGGKIGMSARNVRARRLAATPADVLTRMRRALDAAAQMLWVGGSLTLHLSVIARTMILFGSNLDAAQGHDYYSHGASGAAGVHIAVLAPVLPLTAAGAALGAAAAMIGATLYLRDTKLWLVHLAAQLAALIIVVVFTVMPMDLIGVVTDDGSELALECYWLFTAVHTCALVALSVFTNHGWIEWADKRMQTEVSHVPAPRAPPPPPRDNVMY